MIINTHATQPNVTVVAPFICDVGDCRNSEILGVTEFDTFTDSEGVPLYTHYKVVCAKCKESDDFGISLGRPVLIPVIMLGAAARNHRRTLLNSGTYYPESDKAITVTNYVARKP